MQRPQIPVLLRAIAVALFVMLVTVQVVRTAAVDAWVKLRPARAAAIWSAHPDVQRSVAMAEVGAAAARLRDPSRATLQRLHQVALAAPLATEPFLVHAAIAQRAGDNGRAERLLRQARRRNPRSAAARFLLADLYFRMGRIVPGLAEVTVLARLIPGAYAQVAPALAAYARRPGALPHLKRIVRRFPELESVLLSQLAADAGNVDLILALAEPTSAEGPSPWQAVLLNKLVEQGAYARAHSVWAHLSGIPDGGIRGLFNPTFAQSKAPPPFNWTLGSGSGGVAEPSGRGLRVLYFGRDDMVFASQLLVLPKGRYRLKMNVAGRAGGGREISWTATCLPANRQVLELPLGGRGTAGSVAGEFEVSRQGCTAQKLDLKGTGKEFPEMVDFRISGVKLARIGG